MNGSRFFIYSVLITLSNEIVALQKLFNLPGKEFSRKDILKISEEFLIKV